MFIFRCKTRVLDRIRTTNANQVECSNDGLASTDNISVNKARISYLKAANTKDWKESIVLMTHANTDHGEIQSPQDEDVEKFLHLLNATAAEKVAKDQTNTNVHVCD